MQPVGDDALLRERQALALDASGIGCWEWDGERGILRGDSRTCDLLGVAPDAELSAADVAALVSPDDREELREAALGVASGGIAHAEFRVVRPDGDVRWLEARGGASSDAQNEGATFRGVLADVTMRRERVREREAAARERTERLHALTAALSVALSEGEVAQVTLDQCRMALGAAAGGVCLVVDDARRAQRLVASFAPGIEPSIVESWSEFPLDAPYPVNDAVRSGALVELESAEEFRTRYPALGSTVAGAGYEGYVAAPIMEGGVAIGSINFNFRERRQFSADDRDFVRTMATLAAQALQRARFVVAELQRREALAVSEARLRLALESLRMLAWEWEPTTDRVTTSRNLRDIYGTDSVPESAAGFAMILPEDRERHSALVRDSVARSQPYTSSFRIRRPDTGAIVWLEERGTPVLDGEGRMLKLVGIVTDISARRAAEEERERLLAEAQAARREAEGANRVKSDFLAAMSHELRTPLNAIAGHSQLMELGIHGPVTPAQHDALARIRRSQQHLLTLIDDVLSFAKLEAGHIEYTLREVRLAGVVDETLPMVEQHLVARALRLEVDVPSHLLVRADGQKLCRILLNLVGNAAKFTPEGGRIRIDATAGDPQGDASASGVVQLRVTDSGIGIPPDKLEAIFDPFVQVHRTHFGASGGTGLGLAISRDLARGMGGELTVESMLGGGSMFTLRLAKA